MNFGEEVVKPWKDIWGSGQGIGAIKEVTSAAEFVDKLYKEYFEARDSLISRSVVRKI
jgi:nitronate monooxygenase